MFGSVAVSTHSIDDYAPVVGREAIDGLRRLAEPFQGLRVLALSSPGASGAVRSMLQSSVPLLHNLGLDASWQQVRVPSEHVEMDKDVRRALSGIPVNWTPAFEQQWRDFNAANAALFDQDYDVVIVHHTASVALLNAMTQVRGQRPPGIWIWNSHRDYRAALPQVWSLIRMNADAFDASVYDYKPFIRDDAPTRIREVIPPGVDPLGPRTSVLSDVVRETIVKQHRLDLDRPILAQIILSLREDDPLKVFDTYEIVKRTHPEVQLLIVNLLSEGPDTADALNALRFRGEQTEDVKVLTEMDRIGNIELSALRAQASVLVHQGIPRGISIELLEEMWQAKPIVSARSPMAEAVLTKPLVAVLADTPAQQARAIAKLLADPAEAAKIGQAAHQRIADRHLVTHYLAGYLKLFAKLLRARHSQVRA